MITESEIIDAIKRDEFIYYYQPKISLITGKVCGAEALIRWIKPDGTMIPPNAFIPIAERSSLIKEITRHMLPKLVNDQLIIMDLDNLATSFNTSARDFEDDALTRLILKSLKTAQLPTDCIEVEITETAALESGSNIKANIQPLRDAGLPLSMDDFGKGYSSIDTLSQWPFSTIKLDQGIISRMLQSERSLTIINSSIRMAHELDIMVVAEGVENCDQYSHLLESGCKKIQGFWISKPIPLDQYIDFVKNDKRWLGLPIGLIHMAVIDHIQWRKKLVSEVIKSASYPKNSKRRKCLNLPALSCTQCKLGVWYYGLGQDFLNRESFKEIEKPHRELHEIGTLLANLVQDGAGMADVLPQIRNLSTKSLEVLDKMQILADDGLLDMHIAQQSW